MFHNLSTLDNMSEVWKYFQLDFASLTVVFAAKDATNSLSVITSED